MFFNAMGKEENKAMNEFDHIIVPRRGWLDINLKEIWRYRDLILLFVKRNFISRYKQTILGPAWAVIQPLLTTLILTVVFGSLAGLAADGVPPFLFYMCGTVAWTYFSNCLTQTANVFVTNANILGKVYFPRLVMPISTVLTEMIAFAIQFSMFLFFLLYYWVRGAVHPTAYIWMFPLLLLQMALLSLGTGIIVSALTTKYRDLAMLVGFGVQLWMYGTPVAYDIRIVPENLMGIYMLNPMTSVISLFRLAFLGIGTFMPFYYIQGWAATVLILFLGIVLFNHVERTFMDTV